MSTGALPPAVHQWVMDNLKKATLANKAAVSAEMRDIISKAYQEQTLNTLDWANLPLQSLQDPSAAALKRKQQDDTSQPTMANKKITLINKPAVKVNSVSTPVYNVFTDDARAKRAKRFEREHNIEMARQNGTFNPVNSNSFTPNSLVRRIGGHYKKPWAAVEEPVADPNVIDWDRFTIVGKSTSLFKSYLRLTSEPDPKDIRPLAVLQETLSELKRRWRRDQNYPWIKDQFKSLRQDLTVQRIKNEFTVQVYEIHARIALESADLVEFNQCQANLRTLYAHGLKGHNDEFLAYRILYMLHGRNRAELNVLVSQLTPQEKATPEVRHAIAVHMAMATGNYHKFFVLYAKAPNMGGYIMDHYVDRERCAALITMSKSYRALPVSFLVRELGYEDNELPKLLDFLVKHSAGVFTNPNARQMDLNVDLRAAQPGLLSTQTEKYSKVGIKGSI